MRRIGFKIIGILAVMFLVSISNETLCNASAMDVEIEPYSDGSYAIITTGEMDSDMLNATTHLSSSTITKSKTYTYYSSSGVAQYMITLTGKYKYGNGSATCTSASVSVVVYNSGWRCSFKSANCSGNTAYGTVNINRIVNGKVTVTHSKSLSLTCSSSGVFS